jgi:hypothetical protein
MDRTVVAAFLFWVVCVMDIMFAAAAGDLAVSTSFR